MIAKATHGQLFLATGGAHLRSSDVLVAFEVKKEDVVTKLKQS